MTFQGIVFWIFRWFVELVDILTVFRLHCCICRLKFPLCGRPTQLGTSLGKSVYIQNTQRPLTELLRTVCDLSVPLQSAALVKKIQWVVEYVEVKMRCQLFNRHLLTRSGVPPELPQHCFHISCRTYRKPPGADNPRGWTHKCSLDSTDSAIERWSRNNFFPTCQVRVVRFYQSCCPPLPRLSSSSPPPPISPRPLPSSVCTAGPQSGSFPAQCAPLDLNLGPSQLSVHRWTSTSGLPSSVCTAGPQRPDRMPEDMPDRVLEDMPDRMPEDVPDKVP